MKLLLATRNKGKIKEFADVFSEIGWEIEGLPADAPTVIEDGATFAQNAIKKAETISRLYSTPVLADDSGLEVEALAGRPGVFSARFAGEHADDEQNNLKLLAEMSKVPESERQARFVCVLALARPDQATVTVRGESDGKILTQLQGTSGFGYDPLFLVPEFGKTFAQLTLQEKNRVSHRARAIQTLHKLQVQGDKR